MEHLNFNQKTARCNSHVRWDNEDLDSKNNTLIDIRITRGSANVLLGILARSENGLSMSDQDWERFKMASGEIIGAIWRAKE